MTPRCGRCWDCQHLQSYEALASEDSFGSCWALTSHLSQKIPVEGQRRLFPLPATASKSLFWRNMKSGSGLQPSLPQLRTILRNYTKNALWREGCWHSALNVENLEKSMYAETLSAKLTNTCAPVLPAQRQPNSLPKIRLLGQSAQRDKYPTGGLFTEVLQDVFTIKTFSLLLEDAQKLLLTDCNFAHG